MGAFLVAVEQSIDAQLQSQMARWAVAQHDLTLEVVVDCKPAAAGLCNSGMAKIVADRIATFEAVVEYLAVTVLNRK